MNGILDQVVGGQLFALLLVFARVGAAFMSLPTIGDAFVPVRVRMLLSLAIVVVILPFLAPSLPAQPASPIVLALLLIGEILIGLFLGAIARLLMSALETGGAVIAMQSALANAMIFNPSLASTGSLPGALMGWLGLLLIFVTDMHQVLITGVIDSYRVFPIGAPPPLGDYADAYARLAADSFRIGVQLSAPFIAAGTLLAVALGLIARLAPQIQVFYIFMSTQVALGLLLFAFTLPAMMMFWFRYFESQLSVFFLPD